MANRLAWRIRPRNLAVARGSAAGTVADSVPDRRACACSRREAAIGADLLVERFVVTRFIGSCFAYLLAALRGLPAAI